ncbi:MAG: NAD(P)-dependent alcohol dehydrogenase [Proteobacteria bacterium]|nr:NAD(P)-dependent alcohol dehydrogenase [Pseudomonadota bacterium]
MKAVICTGYGPPEVLKFGEVEKPTPKGGEILIKVLATSCHVGDTRIRKCDIPLLYYIPYRIFIGITKPKKGKNILGMECAGRVEAVGKDVTRLKPGDPVFALTGFSFGAYAEYRCLPDKPKKGTEERAGMVAMKPKNMSYEEAATVPGGGLTALAAMRKLKLQPGEELLIYGASGSLGVFSIQIAKHFGAKVTGVCSTANLEMVKSLGADEVIDYTKGDFAAGGKSYDAIYDAVYKLPGARFKKLLKKGGHFVNSHESLGIRMEDLDFLRELIEKGDLKTFIDKTYPLEEIVKAHRYVDKGHKKGNVAITVAQG